METFKFVQKVKLPLLAKHLMFYEEMITQINCSENVSLRLNIMVKLLLNLKT